MAQALPESPGAELSPEELLRLVYDRPNEAVAAAEAMLASEPSTFQASAAHQTIGLAMREFGELDGAIKHLRRALTLARRSGSQSRAGDVLATLGIALVHAGRSKSGLAALDSSIQLASATDRGRAQFRRAGALWLLGRHDEALNDLREALPALRRTQDRLWTARALTVRANIRVASGLTDRADRDFRAAELIYEDVGRGHEYAVTRHNRGFVAFRAGDLPAALHWFDDADRRYRAAGSTLASLAVDRCGVLLAAGLTHEALAAADSAADDLVRRRGQATRRAELMLLAATAAFAAGDLESARRRAAVTHDLFDRQGRAWFRAHARLLQLQIRFRAGTSTARLLSAAIRVADELHQLGSPDVVQARLLAGRVALATGRSDAARVQLTFAATVTRRGPAATRVSGWLAQALLAESEGRRAAVFTACRRGLAVLHEHQLTLGASELRARVTAQGTELAEIAQRASLFAGTPRSLLVWSERWRATACAIPPVRPPDDRAMKVGLAALRDVSTRLERARERGAATAALDRERSRLERDVRDRTLRTRGAAGGSAAFAVADLLDRLGEDRLLEIVEVDGALNVVICGSGRVRRVAAGNASAAVRLVEQSRWLLRALAYRGASRSLRALADVGARLEAELLGPSVRDLSAGRVVLVPPGRLQGVPWALLPSLDDRVHAVAPSARAWITASGTAAPAAGRVVVVRGPELGSQGAEIEDVAALYSGAVSIVDAAATTAAVIEALDGSGLAHIAAHGEFRVDNPMFSSLRMADGPLTVYDLERLRRAPYRVVLSSCDSGRLQAVGGDEVLGLATALLPLGTAGLVAGLVPVNDAATVPVMVAVHRAVAGGASMPEALRHARREMHGDELARATAWSFVAFGAA